MRIVGPLGVVGCLIGLQLGAAAAPQVTITDVGPPLPGSGPVALATGSALGFLPFVLIGDATGNQVRAYRLDALTGAPTFMTSVPVPGGPSAIALGPANTSFVLVTSVLSNEVRCFQLNPFLGQLTQVGPAVSSGGVGPVAIATQEDGFVLVANKDSDDVRVLRLNQITGVFVSVGGHSVGDRPVGVAIHRRSPSTSKVIVAHTNSLDMQYFEMDANGAIHPRDVENLGAHVTSVAFGRRGNLALGATYPAGDVHGFLTLGGQLTPLGAHPTGGDVTDMVLSDRRIYVTGVEPPRMAVLGPALGGGLQTLGSHALSGVSTRTLATVQGWGGATFVIVNEFHNNQTRILRVE